ncbi:non-ribosomal peptide synthetase [Micromonospora sp. ATCC 39149]|uniref:Amino acid adenylation domain-containing protein n=1 Tax=Micromonospora carbonacea TaxID=47853 RepID=A0A7D6C4V6_9ACTN|nr:amino acid adenylation domain-containing protein [Micromonospora sp. ATCC 39149]EEP71460.1 non-ribosomal peptide synthetase [Micromonospora sp. ATCC 39149]QLJ97724.1 amino acid adenylation domain-containing protein [Micromonospora carbonacea]
MPNAFSNLWELFRGVAGRVPHATALVDEDRTLTYDQTLRRCVEVAAALRTAGIVAGQAVLVSTDHTIQGVLALLSTYAAGAVPVPVDPDAPAPRLRRTLELCGAGVALVDETGQAALQQLGVPLVRVDTATAPTEAAVAASSTAASPAYILFTSGSTGDPKGVVVTQANLLSLIDRAGEWDTSTGEDVWACFHAFTFDVSMWEIWRPLSLGAQLYVVPRAAQTDLRLAYALLAERGVTSLCQTPTACRVFAEHVAGTGVPDRLARLLLAGERLDFAALKPFLTAVADGRLEIWNVYGPTEATVYATAYRITSDDIERERRSLIGRPLPGVSTRVHEPAADGVGELWLAGPGIAAGYLGDAPLTEDRFLADEQQRWYRTGDMVRDVGGGMIEFLGRNGGYLKVRGFRVEPGEIVAAVTACSGITDAAVAVVDTPYGQAIVCAVVRSPAGIVSELELRRHLGQTLPSYMRPGRIVFVDRLPRLSSGKLDPHALRRLVEERM